MNPNYIDLQVNGRAGIDFLSAQDPEEIRTVSKAMYEVGVIGYLPTLITANLERVKFVAALIEDVRNSPRSGESEILGIHLEGPFISRFKRGVHPEQYIRDADISELDELFNIAKISIVTLAPEIPGALDAIKFIRSKNIVASLGHSNANLLQAHAGFEAGATSVTHLWNAMRKPKDEPGLASAALERDDVWIQMIVDDLHLSRELVASSISMAPKRFILTNDSVASAGLQDGIFSFGEMEITITEGAARRVDGTLAGGSGNLDQSLQILREIGIASGDALASVTSRPLTLLSGVGSN